MFRNSPQPTRTETESAFQLGFLAMLGNVKGLHPEYLRRCRVRHPAGFRQHHGDVDPRAHARSGGAQDSGIYPADVLSLFVGEAVVLALVGGIAGSLVAFVLGVGARAKPGFCRSAASDQ